MSDESSAEGEVDPLSLFPQEWREPVEGLAYLGKLGEDISFCGHRFGLKTLLPHEKLAASVAVQPFRNTLAEVDAWQYAHVGLALTSVDDDENFCPPIGPDIEIFAKGRLNWIGKNLYPPTVEFLWARYSLLEATASLGAKELDRLLKGSQPTNLPPWLDSLIGQGTSPEETTSDSPPFIPSSND